jgi:hypothetical protein
MAGKVKASKTNVSARQEMKSKKSCCKFCGNEVSVVMRVSPTGKKKMVRTCCE